MPYATVQVEVDVGDVLADLPASQLRRVLSERGIGVPPDGEAWTPAGFAADLRSAFYARNASRFEALLTVLERFERAAA